MKVLVGSRLVAAILAALAVSGGIGVVVAGSHGPAPALPSHLAIPAVRLGDRVSYVESLVSPQDKPDDPLRKYDVPAAPHPYANFAWSEGGVMADRHGLIQRTDRVDLTRWSSMAGRMMASNSTLWLAAGNHSLVAATMNAFSRLDGDPNPIPALPSVIVREERFEVWYGQDFGAPTCEDFGVLVLGPGQGTELATDQPLDAVPAWCPPGDWAQAFPPYHAAAVEKVEDTWSVRWDTPASSIRPRVSIWLAPGIAYPIRIDEWAFPGHPEFRHRIELAGYDPGATPLATAVPPRAAPDLVLAPRKPWGPDDAGVSTPFPLSLAYAYARDHFADAQNFLAGHPHANTAAARFHEEFADSVQGSTLRTWTITLSDGSDFLDFHVNETSKTIAGQSLPTAVAGPQLQVARDPNGYRPPSIWGAAQARDLEADLPTVASLMARWKAYADPAWAPPSGWAFTVACSNTCTFHTEVQVGTWQERESATNVGLSPDPVLASNRSIILRSLSFVANGKAWQLADDESRVDDGQSLLAPRGVDAPEGRPATAAVLPPSSSARPWLSSNEATGLGVVGILVGLGVYFGPLAKGGAMGLFSRLQPSRIREHPLRRLVMRAVEEEPGIHFRALQRRLGVPDGTLSHHLAKLAQAGAIEARKTGGYTCYFAATPSATALAQVPAAKSSGARAILEAAGKVPGMSNLELAAATGLSPSTVNAHVKRLVEVGLLSARRVGRRVEIVPADA